MSQPLVQVPGLVVLSLMSAGVPFVLAVIVAVLAAVVAFALLRSLLDSRIRNREDVERTRIAGGTTTPLVRRRPAKGSYGEDYVAHDEGEWTGEDLGERPVSDKRLRRTVRDARATAYPRGVTEDAPADADQTPAEEE